MMQIQSRPFTSIAEYQREAKARSRRLWAPRNARQDVSAVVVQFVEHARPRLPLWRTARLNFDDHVIRWKMRIGKKKYREFVKLRCDELGAHFPDIVGFETTRTLSRLRHDLMLELRQGFTPPPSYSEIGQVFGGRDHSTCVHGVQSAAARALQPMPVALTHLEQLQANAELAGKVKEDFLAGLPFDRIGANNGLSKESVRVFIYQMGWVRPKRADRI